MRRSKWTLEVKHAEDETDKFANRSREGAHKRAHERGRIVDTQEANNLRYGIEDAEEPKPRQGGDAKQVVRLWRIPE